MLTGIIERVKAAKIDLNCLGKDHDFATQHEVSKHLDAALRLLQDAVAPVHRSLDTNGRDNPSCPQCRHYNAMLTEFTREELPKGHYLSVCRDCGYKVIGERIFKEVK